MTKKEEEDKEKIKELEKRLEELEREKREKSEGSLAGDLLGGFIPGLGKLVSKLSRASPEFQKRIEETDKEIRFRLEQGWSNKPRIEYSFSTRPLVPGTVVRKEEDIKSVMVWEETPPVEEGDLKVYPIGKKLVIETRDKKYRKEVPLECYIKDIETKYKKGEKKGLLLVKMKKR